MRYIAVIFAIIQCCYAGTVINTKEEFQRFVYETGWRANAGYYDKESHKDKWYSAKTYEDSIYKVIPQAIADCLQKKAEFSNVGEIVTFEANNHTQYSYENWNAVVLWNYLEYAIHKHGALNNDGVSEVGEKLKTHYGKDYGEYINKAVSDIQTYATDLNLYDYIKEVQTNQNNNKYYTVQQEFKAANKSATIHLQPCNITINITNGKVSGYKTALNTVPTSKDEIHALPNFAEIYNENGVDISANKCWFNSVMLNLYNSKTFHKVINDLQKQSHDSTMPSYWIQKIFNDIRTGDMTHYGDHLKGLIRAMKELEIDTSTFDSGNDGAPYGDAFCLIKKSLSEEWAKTQLDELDCFDLKLREREFCYINNCQQHCEHLEKALITSLDEKNFLETILNTIEPEYDDEEELCEYCKEYTTFHKKHDQITLPELLVFKIDSPSERKKPVECSESLTINIGDGFNVLYKLIGTVEQPYKGHFTANIRINSANNRWFNINDWPSRIVKKIDFNDHSPATCVAFYEKESIN